MNKIQIKQLIREEIYKLIQEENIPGGLSKNMSIKDIASLHAISIKELIEILKTGIKVEMEHTSNVNFAKEIALDHIVEDPNYYIKLQKIE